MSFKNIPEKTCFHVIVRNEEFEHLYAGGPVHHVLLPKPLLSSLFIVSQTTGAGLLFHSLLHLLSILSRFLQPNPLWASSVKLGGFPVENTSSRKPSARF